jgi:hypothetical protein
MFQAFLTILLAAWAMRSVAQAQQPLQFEPEMLLPRPKEIKGDSGNYPSRLHGRFLHITGLFVRCPQLYTD